MERQAVQCMEGNLLYFNDYPMACSLQTMEYPGSYPSCAPHHGYTPPPVSCHTPHSTRCLQYHYIGGLVTSSPSHAHQQRHVRSYVEYLPSAVDMTSSSPPQQRHHVTSKPEDVFSRAELHPARIAHCTPGYQQTQHVINAVKSCDFMKEVACSQQCVNCGQPCSVNSEPSRRDVTGQYLCNNCCLCQASSLAAEIQATAARSATRKPSGASNRRQGLVCSNCKCSNSTLWRRNHSGQTVCNACGLYYKLHGIARPASMRKDGIQTRKRRPKLLKNSQLGGATKQHNGHVTGDICERFVTSSLQDDVISSQTPGDVTPRCASRDTMTSPTTPRDGGGRYYELGNPRDKYSNRNREHNDVTGEAVISRYSTESDHKHNKELSCCMTSELPWYGVGCLPQGAVPVQHDVTDYVTDQQHGGYTRHSHHVTYNQQYVY